ncbi:MAG: CehA/McbA family metallohydrolase [Pirellulales bacterium]
MGLVICAAAVSAEPADNTVRLEIKVADAAGEPLPCRVHLRNERGEPQRVAGQPFWHDHFVCSGDIATELNPGVYDYEVERGPEYERKAGKIECVAGKTTELGLTLKRVANLRQAGWYSGDLHVHRPLEEIEQLMAAEDLDFAPVITWWNNRNLWKDRAIPRQLTRSFDGHRLYQVMAGEDEREGGALLYFGLDRPLDLTGSKREVPSPMFFVEEARQRNANVWIDIEKPFWWDVPVWLASGRMTSIGLANNHMCRSSMLANEAWGKPRDRGRLPDPRGNGFWTQEIYYQLLNSGLRIPPSAGSASGVLPNPVGYNRIYVHLDKPFTPETWFEALARGQSFVTNGPLLVVKANDQLPGATFKAEDGKGLAVNLEIQLTSTDRISRLELIHNGEVVKTIDCSDELTQQRTVRFTLDEPGWFLVCAVADVEKTFRFASTAPWFVETDAAKHRISRRSAQFFLDWTDERIRRVKANLADEVDLRQVLPWHDRARTFWAQRVEMANAE